MAIYQNLFNINYNIIISIKPRYSSLILKGEKLVEFRKSFSTKNIDRCYIYASTPQKQIVGYFTIKSIDIDTPINLWEKYGDIGGIEEKDFFSYYRDKEKGHCIIIKDVIIFKEPLVPQDIIPQFKAPQSYCYLEEGFSSFPK